MEPGVGNLSLSVSGGVSGMLVVSSSGAVMLVLELTFSCSDGGDACALVGSVVVLVELLVALM